MRDALDQMFKCLDRGPEVYQPSKFWQQLNEDNVAQLEADGLQNVKRTLAQNYFTWVVGFRSPLFKHLAHITPWTDWPGILNGLPAYDRKTGLSVRRFYELQVFTRMTWKAAERIDARKLLAGIEEPQFGNPFSTRFAGRLISQDLANSVIELYSITAARSPAANESFTVCELGAGYGRNAYAFLKTYPRCKYIIVDIPPALYVSQEYLAQIFPERKIMRFQCFDAFEQVQQMFDAADIVFLLPHQLAQMAAKSVDFFVNISSLHEMTKEQIAAYYLLIARATRGYFYTKQWTSFVNARDGITVSESDYPKPADWQQVYRRTPLTHPLFFEALYQIA